MQRESRLRRSADFERTRTKGRSWTHPILACHVYARSDSARTRVGITVGRRTGKAVVRNRVRRRIREAVRPLYALLPAGYDVVLTARSGAEEAGFAEISRTVAALLARSGLLGQESEAARRDVGSGPTGAASP